MRTALMTVGVCAVCLGATLNACSSSDSSSPGRGGFTATGGQAGSTGGEAGLGGSGIGGDAGSAGDGGSSGEGGSSTGGAGGGDGGAGGTGGTTTGGAGGVGGTQGGSGGSAASGGSGGTGGASGSGGSQCPVPLPLPSGTSEDCSPTGSDEVCPPGCPTPKYSYLCKSPGQPSISDCEMMTTTSSINWFCCPEAACVRDNEFDGSCATSAQPPVGRMCHQDAAAPGDCQLLNYPGNTSIYCCAN